jgi:2-polyprenyl-3-methyl-5-hydroxy-6-metoxy-1,4-benzoquinol methylase
MNPDIRKRLDDAFTRPESETYRRLRELSARTGSDHLEYLFDRPDALTFKIARSLYVAGQVRSRGGRVLDFGSGCGFLACALAEDGAAVVGIECNEPRRQAAEFLAKEVFQVPGVEFRTGLEGLEPNSFNAVILANVISHVRDLPGS